MSLAGSSISHHEDSLHCEQDRRAVVAYTCIILLNALLQDRMPSSEADCHSIARNWPILPIRYCRHLSCVLEVVLLWSVNRPGNSKQWAEAPVRPAALHETQFDV